jgi:hypothetical protein
MTTQTALMELRGPQGSRKFSATATDAAMTEITSTTGTLSLGDTNLRGKLITHAVGQFAAGLGLGRVRDKVTNEIKAHIFMDVIGEEIARPLMTPFVVGENDILEAYTDVA